MRRLFLVGLRISRIDSERRGRFCFGMIDIGFGEYRRGYRSLVGFDQRDVNGLRLPASRGAVNFESDRVTLHRMVVLKELGCMHEII